jgi:site-specific recombinase XerD
VETFNQIFEIMATSLFFLREPKSTNETLIQLIYRLPDGKKFKYSTGESVNPVFWDKKSQRAFTNLKRNPEQLEKNKSINFQLDRYSMKLTEVLSTIKTQGQPLTSEALRGELDKEFKKDLPSRKTDLFGFIENFIETVKFTRTTPIKPINELTKKKYRTTLKLLRDFADKTHKGKLDFNDIDLEFYQDFIEFLQKEHNHGTNTIGKYIQTLKVFLREAIEKGLSTNIKFESRKFATIRENVEHIYLTESELTQLYELDLTSNKRLEAVRDLFIIGCYTALRFSDFTTIRPENIIETESGKALKITTYKTKQLVYVPLHWRVEVILQKYENHLPRAVSNQKMNDYLKELGKLAGIDSPFETTKTKAGLMVSKTQPKYELITTHTARRSAATNMFKAGIPSISIMKVTGHKTESVFLKYINVSERENAMLLMGHEYFTKGRMKAV